MKIKGNGINLYDTLFSGQCFRVFLENDNSYTVILKDRVVNIKEKDEYLYLDSNNLKDLDLVVSSYLDLGRDYEKVNKLLANENDIIKNNIDLFKGYHILKQDKFEMFITYIISQNNRVSQISKSVEKLSALYGEKVSFKGKDYYLFPTLDKIKDITVEEIRNCGVGFRDVYIKSAIDFLNSNKMYLDTLDFMETKEALDSLTRLKGIGTKVASCILLFAYSRFDTFPIDTWVRKFVSKNFNIKDNVKEISKYMRETFKENCGLAIQYFYHIERNKRFSS